MKKLYGLIFVLINFSSYACQPGESAKSPQREIERVHGGALYLHDGVRSGLGPTDKIFELKGYIYNDTSKDISFDAQGTILKLKPYELAAHPRFRTLNRGQPPSYTIQFQRDIQNAPLHRASMRNWFYPGIGDYGIVIKKDTTGVTDLDMDVISKKELDELVARRAKEIQQKVGEKIQESGVNPKPVANIAAEYVGTDIELPE